MGIFAGPTEEEKQLRRQRADQSKAHTARLYATRYRKERKAELTAYRRLTRPKPSIWIRYGQAESS